METERLDLTRDQRLGLVALVLGVVNMMLVVLLARERLPQLLPAPTPTPTTAAATLGTASDSADLVVLQSAVTDLASRVATLEEGGGATVAAPAPAGGAKETVLYLGTGSTTSRDWTTIDSAAITLDTADYGRIKEIRFEAASSILSGEVYTRLLNKSTGAVYYDSNLIHNKSASEWHTSPPLYLPSGRFTYTVQLRSSNNDRANLDGARLKILTH